MNKFKQKPNGQAIVLIAMLMIVLLAITGLAIDGGGIYLLYRDAQNASDAAALSAIFSFCTGKGDYEQAGLMTARENGFITNNVDTFVNVYNPPRELAFVGQEQFIEVQIEAIAPQYFIQLVTDRFSTVKVSTIAECVIEEGNAPQIRIQR